MRESGILMPVSSLPGPYGIGCFGKKAEKFVDFLAAAGQKIWQILPLSPTGYGDSPYQSCSAFAGNPYFIDLDALKEEGLLTAAFGDGEGAGGFTVEVDRLVNDHGLRLGVEPDARMITGAARFRLASRSAASPNCPITGSARPPTTSGCWKKCSSRMGTPPSMWS